MYDQHRLDRMACIGPQSALYLVHIDRAPVAEHLANRIAEVPKDKPVLTYCRTGNRASAAAALLAREGYEVTLVDGEFATWPRLRPEAQPAGAA